MTRNFSHHPGREDHFLLSLGILHGLDVSRSPVIGPRAPTRGAPMLSSIAMEARLCSQLRKPVQRRRHALNNYNTTALDHRTSWLLETLAGSATHKLR
jgi:hypothetical protein